MNFSIILTKNILMDTVIVASVVNVSAQVRSILMLNGTKFKILKDTIEIVLNFMDLDITLRQDKSITIEENVNEVQIEK